MKKRDTSLFTDWVLNNRFSVGLINVLLVLVIVLVFNKISFILNPVNTFISAILPPLLVAMVQYYLMEPVVDKLEEEVQGAADGHHHGDFCYSHGLLDLGHQFPDSGRPEPD
jgi:hypothetical protein